MFIILLLNSITSHYLHLNIRFANIPITGQLDAQTREYISKPRCGMPDITNNSMRKRNRKYVAQGSRWAKLVSSLQFCKLVYSYYVIISNSLFIIKYNC